MFVVVTMFACCLGFACWLSWQARIVAARAAILSKIEISRQQVLPVLSSAGPNPLRDGPDYRGKVELPWVRRLMGDKVEPMVILPVDATPEEVAAALELFPESGVFQSWR